MSGIPKRERKNLVREPEKKEITYEDVEAKLHKAPLTVKEIVLYLLHNNPDGTTTDKTIKNHIADICKKSDGLLCEDDFKEDRKFLFKPEYHGLLLALLDTAIFDDRKNDRKLRTKRLINEQIARNIDKYLLEADANYIKQTPMYLMARIEDEAFKRINRESSAILRALYHTDASIRWKSLKEYLDALAKVRCSIQHRACDSIAKRLVYAHGFEERKDALEQKGLFKAESLESLMINLLAYRVNENFKEGLSPEGTIPALFMLAKLFRYTPFTDDSIKNMIEDIDVASKNNKRYRKLEEKAKKILDLDDPYEKHIFEMLMFYSSMIFLINYIHSEDYQGMQRYMESVVQHDMWDILNMFVQHGRKSYTKEELQMIHDLQDKYK